MIITKLQGGLANQLFQYAYGKALSLKYNTPLFLDINSYSNQSGITVRNFSLSKFPNLKYEIAPNEKNLSFWTNENKKYLNNLSDNFIYKELNYNEDSHYYLNGYWQSEKYFKSFRTEILQELKTDKTFDIEPNSVSIHIRRTDYTTSNGFHPVQSLEYYKKAVSLIGEYNKIYVFSDDIPWCKENLTFDSMVFVEGNDDIDDLLMMSQCRNNIIANSSFSWWAAWMNENEDKKVIAPINWFGSNANLNTDDIIPENWIKI